MDSHETADTLRALIAMRRKHAGNKRITTRITSMINQVERLDEEPLEDHARRLRNAITRSMVELRQILADGEPAPIAADRVGASS